MGAKHVLMIAAEDGALPAGRVTAIGETTRALPVALAAHGWDTTLLSPSYGVHAGGGEPVYTLAVSFAGDRHEVGVHALGVDPSPARHIVLDHPRFSPQGPGKVYCHDGPGTPFATDATKFAFFSAAAAAFVRSMDAPPDVVHVHDWHGALYFALRAFDEECAALRAIRSVFTVRSLAVQGRRPLAFCDDSLRSWFGALSIPRTAVVDPHYDDCANPTACALRLADAVGVGSPTFAGEIVHAGASGAFGLASLLREAGEQGRLHGILDGCNYPPQAPRKRAWRTLARTLNERNTQWIAQSRRVSSAHFIADKNLAELPRSKPALLLTGGGTLDDTGVDIYRRDGGRNVSVLEAIVGSLRGSERFVLLGAGDPAHEQFLVEIAARYSRLVFLRATDRRLAATLGSLADVHLLPFTNAPGPGPALAALRDGTPVVAHAVGGFADVVRDNDNGWLFRGRTPAAQARNFLSAVKSACVTRRAGGQVFARHTRAAAATRHEWAATAQATVERLYTGQ